MNEGEAPIARLESEGVVEDRFAGLMIASKVAHDCDSATLEKILEAVGVEFIERLLLPLNTGQTGALNPSLCVLLMNFSCGCLI